MKIKHCICCKKEIKEIHEASEHVEEWEGMWRGGIVERISAGYGSRLDGNMYLLAICDDCIIEKKLKYIGNYMINKD